MATETPRYQLTTAAFMPKEPGGRNQYLEAETVITFEGVPSWHMRPLNDAAKDAVKKAFPSGQQDPGRVLIQKVASTKFEIEPKLA